MNELNIWLQRLAVGGIVFLIFLVSFYLLSLLLPVVLLGFIIYWGSRLVKDYRQCKMSVKPKEQRRQYENPAFRKNRKPEIIDAEYEIIDDGK